MVVFRSVGDFVYQLDRDLGDVGSALFGINAAVHVGVFSGTVAVLFKIAEDFGGALIETAAGFDVGDHLLFVVFDGHALS